MKVVGNITDINEDLSDFKQLLSLESIRILEPSLMDEFLKRGKLILLDTYEPMIDAGVYDPNIYIVKKGLVRGTYLDKNVEKTAGFALPGTILISFHSFYAGETSYYRFEACCPTEVVKISKEHFDAMIANSHEFALWIMSAHQNQLFYNECKNRMLSGDAKSKLKQLTSNISGKISVDDIKLDPDSPSYEADRKNKIKRELYTRWNEIFQLVPSKIIASYLGITEQHLSKIKRELLTDDSNA